MEKNLFFYSVHNSSSQQFRRTPSKRSFSHATCINVIRAYKHVWATCKAHEISSLEKHKRFTQNKGNVTTAVMTRRSNSVEMLHIPVHTSTNTKFREISRNDGIGRNEQSLKELWNYFFQPNIIRTIKVLLASATFSCTFKDLPDLFQPCVIYSLIFIIVILAGDE